MRRSDRTYGSNRPVFILGMIHHRWGLACLVVCAARDLKAPPPSRERPSSRGLLSTPNGRRTGSRTYYMSRYSGQSTACWSIPSGLAAAGPALLRRKAAGRRRGNHSPAGARHLRKCRTQPDQRPGLIQHRPGGGERFRAARTRRIIHALNEVNFANPNQTVSSAAFGAQHPAADGAMVYAKAAFHHQLFQVAQGEAIIIGTSGRKAR